jgi:hypothetical protein
MTFPGTFGNFGILGYGVNGFTLDHSTLAGTYGNNNLTYDSAVSFCGLTGSASITNDSIANGAYYNLSVANDGGTLNRLSILNDTIGLTQNTGSANFSTYVDACATDPCGSATTLNTTVEDSTFQGANTVPVVFQGEQNSTMDIVFGQPGHGNTVHNTEPSVVPGSEDFDINSDGTATFDVNSNHFDVPSIAPNTNMGGVIINAAESHANMSGYFRNNTIGNSGVANSGSTGAAAALDIESNDGGDMTIDVDSNQIYQFNGPLGAAGVWVIPHGALTAGAEPTVFNMTFTNNTVQQQGTANASPNQIQGFQLDNETSTSDGPNGEAFTTCLKFQGNTINGAGNGGGGQDVRLRQRFDSKVDMPGYTGASNGGASFIDGINYIQGLNPTGPPLVSGTASTSTGGGFFNTPGGAACALPGF